MMEKGERTSEQERTNYIESTERKLGIYFCALTFMGVSGPLSISIFMLPQTNLGKIHKGLLEKFWKHCNSLRLLAALGNLLVFVYVCFLFM